MGLLSKEESDNSFLLQMAKLSANKKKNQKLKSSLPTSFNTKEEWPSCAHDVRD